MSDIWSEALEGLEPRLGAQTFDLWLRPIALRKVEDDRLHGHALAWRMRDGRPFVFTDLRRGRGVAEVIAFIEATGGLAAAGEGAAA